MAHLDSQRLEAVFESRPDIIQGIVNAADCPDRIRLFNEITAFVEGQLHDIPKASNSKKRRLDVSNTMNGSATHAFPVTNVKNEEILLRVKDISIIMPLRKKVDLSFTQSHLYASVGDEPVPGIIYPWNCFAKIISKCFVITAGLGQPSIQDQYSFYVPVPEKSPAQYYYVLMPAKSALHGLSKSAGANVLEPLVFIVGAGAPKPGSISGTAMAKAQTFSDSYSTLFHWSLTANLPASARIVASDPQKFHSNQRESHRGQGPAVYMKAFRGSKDGFLYFLGNGILWGFKKPLLFIPLTAIVAVSYCNVLRTTFNMVVEVQAHGDDAGTEEIEFSMLDQADHPVIDSNYVQKHGLQDRSMAERRRAKAQISGIAGEAEKTSVPGTLEEKNDEGEMDVSTGRSFLDHAQWEEEQRLQDEEDAEEEDYVPDQLVDSDDGSDSGSNSGSDSGSQCSEDDDEASADGMENS